MTDSKWWVLWCSNAKAVDAQKYRTVTTGRKICRLSAEPLILPHYMVQGRHLISTSIVQAFGELRVNKLRTFLSLLGITIGIFCIIAVLTVIDSLERNIQDEMNTLGSDVLYIGRWPWMDEGGEYKWWEYWRRPSMRVDEFRAVTENVKGVELASLCLTVGGLNVKHQDEELKDTRGYAVLQDFDRIQNIDIADGRYLSQAEVEGGANAVVIGANLKKELFAGNAHVVGNTISFGGKKFFVVGVMKLVGQNMAGFDFDNALIYSYNAAATMVDVRSLNYDPLLLVKASPSRNVNDLKYEIEGVLRKVRKVRPGQGNDFSINQLSQVTERITMLFSTINFIGWVIAGFSLIVGGFGIANIMFVTVKERTRIIGLKKAIGARPSSILMEFLIEAITLCIIGGLVGILTVYGLSLVMTQVSDFRITLAPKNFFIGLSVSALVGVLAGYVPARSASKLDPVVAIRSH